MDSTPKDKANTLLQIIGVGDQLAELELKEKEIYNQRHAIGVIADQKENMLKNSHTIQMLQKSLSAFQTSSNNSKPFWLRMARMLVSVKM